MIISELQAYIEKLKHEYGDVPCRIDDGMGFHEIIGMPVMFIQSKWDNIRYALFMSDRRRKELVGEDLNAD